jgi:hypothetical protein
MDTVKILDSSAVALIALVDNGADGVQTETGFVSYGALRLAGLTQPQDGQPLRIAGSERSAADATTTDLGAVFRDEAIPLAPGSQKHSVR